MALFREILASRRIAERGGWGLGWVHEEEKGTDDQYYAFRKFFFFFFWLTKVASLHEKARRDLT